MTYNELYAYLVHYISWEEYENYNSEACGVNECSYYGMMWAVFLYNQFVKSFAHQNIVEASFIKVLACQSFVVTLQTY